MDLFFNNCTKKEEERAYTINDALNHVFSTAAFHGVLNMSVRGKVVCKVSCDARGAATYKFKTISGPFAVAEALYEPARVKLANRCLYEGPPEPLPGSFELTDERRKKLTITFGPPPNDSDMNDDFNFI